MPSMFKIRVYCQWTSPSNYQKRKKKNPTSSFLQNGNLLYNPSLRLKSGLYIERKTRSPVPSLYLALHETNTHEKESVQICKRLLFIHENAPGTNGIIGAIQGYSL